MTCQQTPPIIFLAPPIAPIQLPLPILILVFVVIMTMERGTLEGRGVGDEGELLVCGDEGIVVGTKVRGGGRVTRSENPGDG